MRAIVTGGTDGIGVHIATALVAGGAEVVVTGRSVERGVAAAHRIGATFAQVDHSSLAENEAFAATLRAGPPIDILVNNVGGGAVAERTVTPEGNELVLALNYLGPVTLTRELLPALNARPHIVNVISSAFTMFDQDPFTEPDRYVGITAYARAKQLHLLATLSLARGLGDDAFVNAVNPGMAWTPGAQALTPAAVPAWRFFWPVVRFFQRRASAAAAANAPAAWALRPTGTGRYVESDAKPRPVPARLADRDLQDRAWAWPQSVQP